MKRERETHIPRKNGNHTINEVTNKQESQLTLMGRDVVNITEWAVEPAERNRI